MSVIARNAPLSRLSSPAHRRASSATRRPSRPHTSGAVAREASPNSVQIARAASCAALRAACRGGLYKVAAGTLRRFDCSEAQLQPDHTPGTGRNVRRAREAREDSIEGDAFCREQRRRGGACPAAEGRRETQGAEPLAFRVAPARTHERRLGRRSPFAHLVRRRRDGRESAAEEQLGAQDHRPCYHDKPIGLHSNVGRASLGRLDVARTANEVDDAARQQRRAVARPRRLCGSADKLSSAQVPRSHEAASHGPQRPQPPKMLSSERPPPACQPRGRTGQRCPSPAGRLAQAASPMSCATPPTA